jgi:hypothetical protein
MSSAREVELQTKISNQRHLGKKQLQEVKDRYEKELTSLKNDHERKSKIKAELYEEDKSQLVQGYEKRLDKLQSSTKVSVKKSNLERNRNIEKLKGEFLKEKVELQEAFKKEMGSLVNSYELKLKAHDQKLNGIETDLQQSNKNKVASLKKENSDLREYYNEKIEELKNDYEIQIKDIYKNQNKA